MTAKNTTTSAKAVFDRNISRSKHFMQLRKDLLEVSKTDHEVQDLLRAAFAWTVAALDAYVHDKISEELVGFIRLVLSLPTETEKQREDQNKLASDLIAFLEGSAKSERIGHLLYWSYANKPRPFVHIRAEIDRLLLLRSYQEPSKIEGAFKLIGCRSIFDEMSNGDKAIRSALWKDLDDYSLRRNKIVHEGDRLRGKKASRNTRPMTVRYVNRAIKRIDEIVGLLELEIDKQLKAMRPIKPRGRRPIKPKGRPRKST